MILLQTVGGKQAVQSIDIQKILNKVDLQKLVKSKDRKITFMKGTGIGFGNLVATADNVPPKIRGIPIARACGGSLCKGIFELLQLPQLLFSVLQRQLMTSLFDTASFLCSDHWVMNISQGNAMAEK
ncbi:hypothetical protein IFM89_022134 [Coptis chinensis]|uniref:Uncharacterized protein n=1 Tax=Coptis chinensis TaxID=261450 RepID=A0A835I4D1_9MAGN|nr:hypothetical protein IFM89_022134 [Coptis chinensis]